MDFRSFFGKLLPDFLKRSRRSPADETLFNYRRIWRYAALGTASVSLIPLLVLAIWNFFQFNKAIKAEENCPSSIWCPIPNNPFPSISTNGNRHWASCSKIILQRSCPTL